MLRVRFLWDDPGLKHRKRTDDFVVVKFQSRTAMPRRFCRYPGKYAARASFALVTLGYRIERSPKPGVTTTSGFFVGLRKVTDLAQEAGC